MSKNLFLVLVLILSFMLLSACNSAFLANGENHYCPGTGYLDIIEEEPELLVLFKCTEEKHEFTVEFLAPNDTALVRVIRESSGDVFTTIGVILQDGELIQLYELYANRMRTLWIVD